MGVQASLDTTGLDAVIGMLPRIAEARDEVAKLIAFDWAENVESAEMGEDQPDQRDYDENIVVDEEGPDTTVIETDIEWAPLDEYGSQAKPGTAAARQAAEAHRDDFASQAKPGTAAARQAAEAHREDFTNAVAAAVTG